VDNIKIDLADIECGSVDWIRLAWDTDKQGVMVPQNAGKLTRLHD
jgi:hypothetical protein